MEKRKVTVRIDGRLCSFYSDDSDDYLAALEQRANAVMKETAPFSGPSASTNAVLSVVSLTDALMRAEQEQAEKKEAAVKHPRKKPGKTPGEDRGQVSVWELLEEPGKETPEKKEDP